MGMKAAVRSCTPTSDRAVASSLFFCICFLFLILFFFCFVGYCYEINKMPFYFCHYSTKFLLINTKPVLPFISHFPESTSVFQLYLLPNGIHRVSIKTAWCCTHSNYKL